MVQGNRMAADGCVGVEGNNASASCQRTLDRHKQGRLHMPPPVDLNSEKVIPFFLKKNNNFCLTKACSQSSAGQIQSVSQQERNCEQLQQQMLFAAAAGRVEPRVCNFPVMSF